jgi:hypothetical protein
VALQRARREQALAKESGSGKKTTVEDDGAVFDSGADSRDAKRRKVSAGPEDPFGWPL